MFDAIPIGTVCAFAGQFDPVTGDANNVWKSTPCASTSSKTAKLDPNIPLTRGEAFGWMLCDGRYLDVDAYVELYSVLGYLYGKSGNCFRLPDYRGMFLRGVDSGSGMDPDAESRIGPNGCGTNSGIGSLQCDALQKHSHTYKSVVLSALSQQGSAAGQASSDETTSLPNEPVRQSVETRCRNVSVNYIIKFR